MVFIALPLSFLSRREGERGISIVTEEEESFPLRSHVHNFRAKEPQPLRIHLADTIRALIRD